MHFDPVPFTNNNTPTIYASFVAAPYWADIDNSYTGEIWYEIHTAKQNLTESNSLLRKVSEYIRKEQDEPLFNGSWMLVATWNESFPYLRPLNVSEQEVSLYNFLVLSS